MRKMNHMNNSNSMKIKVRIGPEKTGINWSAKISMTQTQKKIPTKKIRGRSEHLALSKRSLPTKKYPRLHNSF